MKPTRLPALALLVTFSACKPQAAAVQTSTEKVEAEVEVLSPDEIQSDSFAGLPEILQIDSVVTAYAVDLQEAQSTHRAESLDTRSAALTPAELIAVYQTCQDSPNRPKSLAELTAGTDMFQSTLTENQAVAVGFTGLADVSGRREAVVIRYSFLQYARRNCALRGVQIPVVWGVGVASNIHIRQLRGGAKTNGLPGIAASVEFERASVNMRLVTPGLVGQPIREAFPSAEAIFKFDVRSYGLWVVALDKIKNLFEASGVTATPQLLVTDEAIPAITQALRGNNPQPRRP